MKSHIGSDLQGLCVESKGGRAGEWSTLVIYSYLVTVGIRPGLVPYDHQKGIDAHYHMELTH